LRNLREIAVHASAELLAHLAFTRARRGFHRDRLRDLTLHQSKLGFELLQISLRALEIESAARAGARELAILLDTLARQIKARV
jgi:hypothetical protein